MKRIIFWICFLIILALIVWGLVVAMNRPVAVNGVPIGTVSPVLSSDHVYGQNPTTGYVNAKVTLIEYSDFQCPACEVFYYSVAKLLQDEPTTTLRFIYRHFPLSQHANARPAAMAAEAAGLQGKFWEMYELLFKNHAEWTELANSSPIFVGYATSLGLDIAKFTADIKNPALVAHIDADLESGQIAGINSTPTFFINGKAIVNPSSYADFKKLIDQAASSSSL
ncbi:MAG: thioredoxin domain-containing protein [Candidatus Taylorbacteria bacterium]